MTIGATGVQFSVGMVVRRHDSVLNLCIANGGNGGVGSMRINVIRNEGSWRGNRNRRYWDRVTRRFRLIKFKHDRSGTMVPVIRAMGLLRISVRAIGYPVQPRRYRTKVVAEQVPINN